MTLNSGQVAFRSTPSAPIFRPWIGPRSLILRTRFEQNLRCSRIVRGGGVHQADAASSATAVVAKINLPYYALASALDFHEHAVSQGFSDGAQSGPVPERPQRGQFRPDLRNRRAMSSGACQMALAERVIAPIAASSRAAFIPVQRARRLASEIRPPPSRGIKPPAQRTIGRGAQRLPRP
jgi:hypothetical protein